ncbi:hypothetical protein FQZ97_965600 [compost metagenome]
MALGEQDLPVECFVLIARHFQANGLLPVQPRQLQVLNMFEDLGLLQPFGVAQHAETVAQIALELHKTNGDQAVEPGVRQGFHHSVETLLADPLHQSGTLSGDTRRERMATDQQHITGLFDTDR